MGLRVFLSYRRSVSWGLAKAVDDALTGLGVDVYRDTSRLESGEFAPQLLNEITARANFVVLLQPGSLDPERLKQPNDWVRREIAHAIEHERNVVPLVSDDFGFPPAEELPADIARLPSLQDVPLPQRYFDAAMATLYGYLKASDDPAPEPPSDEVDAPVVPEFVTDSDSRSGDVLRWTEVPGAVEYELQSSAGEGFEPARVCYRGLGLQFRPPAADLAYFRVRALRPGLEGHGPWSATVSPARPAESAPRLDAVLFGSVVKLSWSPVAEAARYVVEASPSPAFPRKSTVDVYSGWRLRRYAYVEPSPTSDSRYYRLRVEAGDDPGPALRWSEHVEVTPVR